MDIELCRFCEIEKGNYKNVYDRPIKETLDYFSLASVGAFVPGWSLVVPKKHVYSLREEYHNANFLKFVNEWINHVKRVYGKNIIVFEHGANHCGSQTSCGTNHAHLHIVPYDGSLLEKMLNEHEWISTKYNQIDGIVEKNEYLLYAEVHTKLENSEIYLHILQKEESQFFRRLLANEFNIADYSYRTSPFYGETINSFLKLAGTENE